MLMIPLFLKASIESTILYPQRACAPTMSKTKRLKDTKPGNDSETELTSH